MIGLCRSLYGAGKIDMLFAELILKNVRQRTGRTLMTVIGLAVAVMAITTLWSTVWGYAETSGSYYSARGVDLVVVRAGVSNRLTSSLRADLAQRLAALPGVEAVDVTLTEMVSLGAAQLIGIPLRGYVPGGFASAHLAISEGRAIAPGAEGVVLLGGGIAAALDRPDPQEIEIEGTKFRVAGIFQANNPYDANSVMAPLADVQKLMGRPGAVSEFQIRVTPAIRNEADIRKLCEAIESARGDDGQPIGLKAQSTQQFVNSATEAKLGGAMAWATSVIVLALSLLGMLNTMLMSVLERTSELGVLRAVGWTRTRVVRMILGESFIVSAIGAVVGLLATLILVGVLSRAPGTSLLVPRQLSGAAVMIGISAAIVAGVVGSLYPALRAASIPPIEALRHE